MRYLPPLPPALLVKPKPEEFLLRFNALTKKFDEHREGRYAFLKYAEESSPRPGEDPDWYLESIEAAERIWRECKENAEDLIAQLLVMWSEENPFAAASHECIGNRLGAMDERLPSSEVPQGFADGLISHVVAAAPSAMAVASLLSLSMQ